MSAGTALTPSRGLISTGDQPWSRRSKPRKERQGGEEKGEREDEQKPAVTLFLGVTPSPTRGPRVTHPLGSRSLWVGSARPVPRPSHGPPSNAGVSPCGSRAWGSKRAPLGPSDQPPASQPRARAAGPFPPQAPTNPALRWNLGIRCKSTWREAPGSREAVGARRVRGGNPVRRQVANPFSSIRGKMR